MLTLTLTSDPACRTFPSAMPNAFALNIFQQRLGLGFCAKSLGMERILTSFLSQVCHMQNFAISYQKQCRSAPA
ncbi:MAG: hypothetical protein CM15mP62_21510 [Rhodospirillaceae bacterium]|nr:MAG: hypothetical protein CM15mP62_21510 [Rhodospirillaceae bacterium]